MGDPRLQHRHPRRPDPLKHSQPLLRQEQTPSRTNGRASTSARPFRRSRVIPREVASSRLGTQQASLLGLCRRPFPSPSSPQLGFSQPPPSAGDRRPQTFGASTGAIARLFLGARRAPGELRLRGPFADFDRRQRYVRARHVPSPSRVSADETPQRAQCRVARARNRASRATRVALCRTVHGGPGFRVAVDPERRWLLFPPSALPKQPPSRFPSELVGGHERPLPSPLETRPTCAQRHLDAQAHPP